MNMKYRLNGVLCHLYNIKLPVLATNAVEVKMQGTRDQFLFLSNRGRVT